MDNMDFMDQNRQTNGPSRLRQINEKSLKRVSLSSQGTGSVSQAGQSLYKFMKNPQGLEKCLYANLYGPKNGQKQGFLI
jgi:hypothetical protein